jgi:UDP-GlcNAc:undecaprenyl-phosphate/decaprenyl-phosphate GlcNAc-1-phosphate transferase
MTAGLVLLSALAALVLVPGVFDRVPRRLVAVNHRGEPLPAVLGVVIAAAAALALAVATVALRLAHVAPGSSRWPDPSPAGLLAGPDVWRVAAVAGGAALVVAAGLADDLAGPGGPRGLRGHLGALRRGRLTTGLAKLVALVLAGAAVALALGATAGRGVLVAVTVAGSANLWNGLDVAPGRAGKAFLLAAVPLVALAGPGPGTAVLAAVLGAAAVMLLPDLREAAMLGDVGANLLGFAVGAALAEALPIPWLALAAAAVVALNLLAETVTLSRAISAVPPVRWADRLGRLPPGPAGAAIPAGSDPKRWADPPGPDSIESRGD